MFNQPAKCLQASNRIGKTAHGRRFKRLSGNIEPSQTDFPMKAGLLKREPEILAYWEKIGLYDRLRDAAKDKEKFVLHDGPPYANGDIHIGHALNKILKDIIVRARQMTGKTLSMCRVGIVTGYRLNGKLKSNIALKV